MLNFKEFIITDVNKRAFWCSVFHVRRVAGVDVYLKVGTYEYLVLRPIKRLAKFFTCRLRSPRTEIRELGLVPFPGGW